jgi:hypothetical protein
VYEFLIQVNKPNDLVLKPRFSYFDPEQGVYAELEDKPLLIKVLPGKTSVAKKDHPNENDIAQPGETVTKRPGIVLLILLFSALMILLLYIFYRKQKRSNVQTQNNAAKKLPVMAVVTNYLAAAVEFKNRGDHKAFFNEINKAVTYFLKEELQTGSDITEKETFIRILEEKGAEKNVTGLLIKVLDTCELAMYAGQKPEMETMEINARNLIQSLESLFQGHFSEKTAE